MAAVVLDVPKAPQMLGGVVVLVVVEEEVEPLLRLAARLARPLSAAVLLLGAARGFPPESTKLEVLRDLAGDLVESVMMGVASVDAVEDGVIVMLPEGVEVKVNVSLGVGAGEGVDEEEVFSDDGLEETEVRGRGSFAIFFMFFLHLLQYQTHLGSLTSLSDIFGR